MGQMVSYPWPAPIGGLNVADSWVSDPSEPSSRPSVDARELTNFVTGPNVAVRAGYTSSGTITGSKVVPALFSLPLQAGTEKLIAISDNKIWDASAAGAATEITGGTALTSSTVQGQAFGDYLFLCNGTSTAQRLAYSAGWTRADVSFTGGSTPTLSTLINVSCYKERLYFVQANTGKFWYGNTKAVGVSALVEFDTSYFLRRGGYLMFAGAWTNQLASTSADLFVAVSSQGEVLCYNGSYPGDTTWGLVARFYIGKPLGYAAFIHIENDLWILTDAGIVAMSELFKGGLESALSGVGRKINPLIRQSAAQYPSSRRWTGEYWRQGRRVFVNLPVATTKTQTLCYNIETAAWSLYQYATDSAQSIAIYGATPYWGGETGTVYAGETGKNDNGSPINYAMKLPFSYFGNRQQWKRFSDIRAAMWTGTGARIGLSMQTNFQDIESSATISTATGTFTPWGSAWGSPWSSGSLYFYDWKSCKGQGSAGAIRVKGSVQDAPLEFNGFDVRYEPGSQV